MNSLQSVLFDSHAEYDIHDPDIFFQIWQKVLDNHIPRKKKYVRGNHKPFMNKRLSKAICNELVLEKNFLKILHMITGIFVQNNVVYVHHF